MMRITSFARANEYLLGTIDEFVSRRTSYKLDRMRAFLRELGDPHRAYRTVHVGGTSGKSSTATMIAAALQAAGKRTGLHTKPHLHAMTERARIDGAPIEAERFAALLDAMMPAIDTIASQYGRPTYYETLLALAFFYFAHERVDVAVIEVGLGGRLDGTNVVLPMVAAITSVGYDHTDVLGTTIEAIAFEKAGIAKAGIPLVLAAVPEAARRVIERYAAEIGAPIVYVSEAARRAAGDLRLRTLGAFQRANAATAITVLERIDEDLRPARAEVVRALEALDIPGRMELFSTHPAVVFDVAHNVEKAEALVAALREAFPGRRIHYVVAIGESKDARRILEILAELPSTFTFTSFAASGRKAIRPQRMATIAESLRSWGRAIGDPVEAFTVARRTATIDDVVVVTGSTFLVADLREWYVPSAVH